MLYLTILRGSNAANARTVLAIRDQKLIEEVTREIVKRLDRPDPKPCAQPKQKAAGR